MFRNTNHHAHFICTHIKRQRERENILERQYCVITFTSHLPESIPDEMSGLISPETDHTKSYVASLTALRIKHNSSTKPGVVKQHLKL